MSNKSHFTIYDYEEAKEYLRGSKVISQYKDDIERNTVYRTKDGYMFYEHESLLEGKDGEYHLDIMYEPL